MTTHHVSPLPTDMSKPLLPPLESGPHPHPFCCDSSKAALFRQVLRSGTIPRCVTFYIGQCMAVLSHEPHGILWPLLEIFAFAPPATFLSIFNQSRGPE